MLKTFFWIIFIIIAPSAFGLSEQGKVLQVSKSGRSLVWDRGSFEGVKQGTKGSFILKGPYGGQKVARGEAVRVLPDKSYWILSDIERPALLKGETSLRFFTDLDLKAGRVPERIKRKKVVLAKGQRVSDYENEIRRGGVPDKVVYREDDYREGPPLKVIDQREDFTVETVDYTSWLEDGLRAVENYEEVLEVKKVGSFKKAVPSKKIQDKSQKDMVDSVTDGVVKKIGHKNVEFLDREQMIDSKFVRLREREGPLWSADLDDRQLRRYVLETGMVAEKKRQEFAMENRFLDEFVLRYSRAFPRAKDNTGDSNQGDSFSWALGYEFHLMRLTRVLDSFAIEGYLEYGNGYYEMGAENVRSSEFAFNISGSWYFLNLPSTIGKFLGHLGLGGKIGWAYTDAASFTKSYKYQLRSFPWYFGEFKYRFGTGNDDKASWGLSFMLSYLNTELTVLETLLDDIKGRIEQQEIRWSFGLNFTI